MRSWSWVVLFACGCSGPCTPPPPDPPDPVDPPEPVPTASALDPAAGDLTDEVVVELATPVTACPPPTDGGATLLDPTPVVGRYCRYGTTAPVDLGRVGTDTRFRFPSNGVVSAGYDALVVTPMQQTDPVRAALDAHWLATTRWMAGLPTVPAALATPRPARLEILDSAPDLRSTDLRDPLRTATQPWADPGDDGAGQHGVRMFLLAHDLLCTSSPCAAQLRARQVLGLRGPPAATSTVAARVRQGVWGSFFDAAQGIQAAVDDWIADREVSRREGRPVGSLIVNLSWAWHPLFGGGMPGAIEMGGDGEPVDRLTGGPVPFSWDAVEPRAMPPGPRWVFDALLYARCHGAVVFAAAGNATPGELGGDGPLLPAAWEGFPVDRLDCGAVPVNPRSDLAGVRPPPMRGGPPLVVAVGAVMPDVEASGQVVSAIGVVRPGSTPVITATGYAGVHAPVGGIRTGPALTGTSVSTVVAASTAALIGGPLPPEAILTWMARGPSWTDPAGVEAARHAVGQPIAGAFTRSPLAALTTGTSVWVRTCGLADPGGAACAFPDTVPQAVALPLPADTQAPAPATLLTAPVPAAYPPSMVPTLKIQPDSMMCPECVIQVNTSLKRAVLSARFVSPPAPITDLRLRVQLDNGQAWSVDLTGSMSSDGKYTTVYRTITWGDTTGKLRIATLEARMVVNGVPSTAIATVQVVLAP